MTASFLATVRILTTTFVIIAAALTCAALFFVFRFLINPAHRRRVSLLLAELAAVLIPATTKLALPRRVVPRLTDQSSIHVLVDLEDFGKQGLV